MKYYTPTDYRTGALTHQPRPVDTQSGCYFDAKWAYLAAYINGALDAPDYIPRGAHRAMDCSNLVLGIAHLERP